MSLRPFLSRIARAAIVGAVAVRAQVSVAAAGYFFYGYWFSQRRA